MLGRVEGEEKLDADWIMRIWEANRMYLEACWNWSQNTQIGVLDLSPTNFMMLGMTLPSRPQFPYQVNKFQRKDVSVK